jgi:hypothetical protein
LVAPMETPAPTIATTCPAQFALEDRSATR